MTNVDIDNKPIIISELVRGLKLEKYTTPDFQRDKVWNAQQVARLVDSLYKGYPIGQILLWENGSTSDKTNAIIDGLQRSTALKALYDGHLAEFSSADKTICFDYSTETFSPVESGRKKNVKTQIRVSDIWSRASSIPEIFDQDSETFAIVAKKSAGDFSLTNFVALIKSDGEEAERNKKRVEKLANVYMNTTMNTATIKHSISLPHVIEIFNRMNNSGTRVKLTDSIKVPLLTMLVPDIRDKWRTIKSEVLSSYKFKGNFQEWFEFVDDSLVLDLTFDVFAFNKPEEYKTLKNVIGDNKNGKKSISVTADDVIESVKDFKKRGVDDEILTYLHALAYGYAEAIQAFESLKIYSPRFISQSANVMRVLAAYLGKVYQQHLADFEKKAQFNSAKMLHSQFPRTNFSYPTREIHAYYLLSLASKRYAKNALKRRDDDIKLILSKSDGLHEIIQEMKLAGDWRSIEKQLKAVGFGRENKGRVDPLISLLGILESTNGAYDGNVNSYKELNLDNAERHHIFPRALIPELAAHLCKRKDLTEEEATAEATKIISNIGNITWVDKAANSAYRNSYPQEYLEPKGSKYLSASAKSGGSVLNNSQFTLDPATNFCETRFSAHILDFEKSPDSIKGIIDARRAKIAEAMVKFIEDRI